MSEFQAEFPFHAEDRPQEECGVFGIYAPGVDVARRAFFGIFALQHRGQESAGIAVADFKHMQLHTAMGLVTQIFDEDILSGLQGDIRLHQQAFKSEIWQFKPGLYQLRCYYLGQLVERQARPDASGRLETSGAGLMSGPGAVFLAEIEHGDQSWTLLLREVETRSVDKGYLQVFQLFRTVMQRTERLLEHSLPANSRVRLRIGLGENRSLFPLQLAPSVLDVTGRRIPLSSGEAVERLADLLLAHRPPFGRTLVYADDSVDRLICTCVLHHLAEPDAALSEWFRVVRPGGVVTIYLPYDPGMAYRWVRWFTTHRAQRRLERQGELDDHLYMWAREHRNHVLGLKQLIRHHAAGHDVQAHRWPLPALSWNFNLYEIQHITVQLRGGGEG